MHMLILNFGNKRKIPSQNFIDILLTVFDVLLESFLDRIGELFSYVSCFEQVLFTLFGSVTLTFVIAAILTSLMS